MEKAVLKVARVVRREVNNVLCNKCGKTCAVKLSKKYHMFVHARFEYLGGYGSVFPGDSYKIQFDLCEKCLKWLCSLFKHPPDKDFRKDYNLARIAQRQRQHA